MSGYLERGEQPQVFRNPLRQRLAKGVILNSQRHVVAQHFKSVELLLVVGRFAGPPSQGNDSNQFAADSQRANALEQFRRDVAVRT